MAVLLVAATACSGSQAGDSGTGPSSATSAPPSTVTLPSPGPRYRRPPQFVVVSFDGSGDPKLWRHWRAVGARTGARFSFFLSGVYLLDWAHHDRYVPPAESRGSSAIGFAPDAAWIAAMRRQIALGYGEGNEIGTHYNGHFCGPGGVGGWTAADWSAELDEFDRLLFTSTAKLPFGPGEIVGGRTPCLEGNLDALYPVLRRHGLRYDASREAPLGAWPSKRLGIWSVPLLELPFIGHTFRVVSMDYNLMANQIDETPARIESETYRTFWNAFLVSYRGNRAPLSLGMHFETWESWAYDHAVTRFLLRACRLPQVRCATYRELVDWLDSHPEPRLNHG